MLFYNTGIFLYKISIYIASLFNTKAKLWVKGRRQWRSRLNDQISALNGHPRIWIHCASVGEFEQGRPVIEAIKKQHPQYKIILSFFSPSGYELRKNYELADVVTYLPSDSKSNALDFVNCCKPQTVIFVKYEFWLNYLFELKKQNIPAFLISAVIKKHQPFFKWYGGNFIKALKTYKNIFVQDQESLRLLETLSVRNAFVCGDTRVDRVLAIKEEALRLEKIADFTKGNQILIAGSSWPKDEELILKAFSELRKQFTNLRLIIAPHETNEKNIERLKARILKTGFSMGSYLSNDFDSKDILVINTVGILSSLYQLGYVAYIGGGFNSGIHNILEPAVYGLPVIFGPQHQKFNEAGHLIRLNAATEIKTKEELLKTIENYLQNPSLADAAAIACRDYINANKGASSKILQYLNL